MRMPAKMKEDWIAALRSGEYKQCHHTLHDGQGYCCLGVLQKVVDGEVEKESDGSYSPFPSEIWIEEHGIEDTMDGISAVDHMFLLSGDNDSGYSFKKIADVIERDVGGY